MKVDADRLHRISETMLFTLYLKYKESRRPDGLISDQRYAGLIDSIGYDFSVFDSIPQDFQIGLAARSNVFDTITKGFIAGHPEGTVASLGSGLDFRFERVDNGRIRWFDIDLPEVVDMRRLFFQETDRARPIPASVFDLSWMDLIPEDHPPLFIAEGLFVYFDPQTVKELLIRLAEAFPGSEIAFDVYSNFYLRLGKGISTHPFLDRMVSQWQWGVDDWAEIEAWHSGIRLIGEYYQHELFGDRTPPGFEEALADETLPEGVAEELQKLSRIGHFALGPAGR